MIMGIFYILVLYKFANLQKVVEYIKRKSKKNKELTDIIQVAEKCCKIIDNNFIFEKLKLTCLKRSLILLYLCSNYKGKVSLVIGFRCEKTENHKKILGHAWIEIDDIPMFERGNVQQIYKKAYIYTI
ncbi:lasso peptide biosynthesis B2 protein [Caldicellulosiruptor acetigenus]|uniref:Microcin J25-processing protein McjB C-terminal domain-containing protein n=1 Tax=Caldicellulosiruptor acetigenus 6A TaxID=632516 RepID=G2PTL5_9FIRM|nr:lasso peptide biosynthesis B2 protein [Caldicellulosiruptor acetigenus]AEM74296.1 hypothetical protein Calla_1704 [Caldicellulosiruptor acetigenus 6A]